MPSASRPPSRCSSKLKRKQNAAPELPYSRPIAAPSVVSSRALTQPEWTWDEKLAHFNTLPRILCPASPPPTFGPSETVEQARRRSRQRIEQMTKRLADLPLYQARHILHLASTELKGPFNPGCKYWGTIAPEPEALSPEDLDRVGRSIQKPTPYKPPRDTRALQINIVDPPRFSTPSAPSSTVITGPSTPFTPPSATRVATQLLPSKSSAGRELGPIDYDRPSPTRSPTPAPSLPRSRMGSQVISGSRPPETPASASQRAFIMNLQQASRASSVRSRRSRTRSARGLKILASVGPPAFDRTLNHDRTESRDQSPLSRFSQRKPNGATAKSKASSQLPGPSNQNSPAPISEQESPETYTYNSEFSVERHIDEIGQFMEADIRR
ncbi:hypothetical protein RSOL_345370 [Rhizoctonia solani AG-3 Rhs1AP]|uniref:Uncharacterized protein n=2 Tax=Rhizoctonia solani AG-3 TaxID=1086053 RepID=A0A074RM90_9AGAM|nr:hypothetical protein RSOL_345370 [Rhizoctonia solani AG-3 Rhs1AP]KEP47959.1 hypothetical protein V565_138150 [Rhizoctonia solani 123E]